MILHLQMLADSALVPETATYVAQVARRYGVPLPKTRALLIVLKSILTRRLENIDKSDPDLVVEVDQRKGQLVVSVADKGVPYVLTKMQKEILSTRIVDKFLFEQLGTDGQRISVFFNLKAHHIDPAIPEPREEALLDDDFGVRLTRDDDKDIVQVIQCIYTSYGYNYLHQQIYHTDLFREMLHGGKYVSALAENAHRQVVGHIALEEHEWFGSLMEVCNLVVKPIARGHHIGNVLVDSIIRIGEERNLNGLFAMPVMFHPISQKLLNEHGFTPCGMYFHLVAADSSKQYGDGTGRLDTAFCVHAYNKSAAHVLCLPDECASFVRDVFEAEQLAYSVSQSPADKPDTDKPAPPATATTSFTYTVDPVSKVLEVKVDTVGSDYKKRMAMFERQEDLDAVEVVMLYLNMSDPLCPDCYDHLRSCGFIFSGFLPGSADGDYLMLQHLRHQPIVKASIVTEPGYDAMLDALYKINGIG